jgi:hypothetical protein
VWTSRASWASFFLAGFEEFGEHQQAAQVLTAVVCRGSSSV